MRPPRYEPTTGRQPCFAGKSPAEVSAMATLSARCCQRFARQRSKGCTRTNTIKRYTACNASSTLSPRPVLPNDRNRRRKAPTALERLRTESTEYETYLREQRGLTEATIYCVRFLERFMTFRFGAGLSELDDITPADIVAFLRVSRSRCSPPDPRLTLTRERAGANCANLGQSEI
jgi:hypothetical protein